MPDISGFGKMASPIAKTDGVKPDTDDAKLKKATREMEAYFVGTLLKKMHETSQKGGLFGDDSESQTYREMFDDSLAAEIGKKGSFGIADMLYRELSLRKSLNESDPGSDADAAASKDGVKIDVAEVAK